MFRSSFLPLIVIGLLAGCAEDADAGAEATPDERLDTRDAAKASPSSEQSTVGCDYPIRSGDTAEALKQRFGEDALVTTLPGPEGEEIPGVILWPGQPERTMHVGFTTEDRDEVAYVTIYDGSQWSAAGLHPGDTLEQIVQVNGAPISFFGFEWDYGGLVHDFGGGALERGQGCGIFMSLAFDYKNVELPLTLVGDRSVSSDHPDIVPGQLFLWELGLSFPPSGQSR